MCLGAAVFLKGANRAPRSKAPEKHETGLLSQNVRFYEWRKEGKKKIPMLIRLKSGGEFTFPGLWDTWRQRGGNLLSTYTVLTTAPNELVKPIHDRMPVILREEAADKWLTCTPEAVPQCLELLKPYPAEEMTADEVSPMVNSGKVDSPECIKPVAA